MQITQRELATITPYARNPRQNDNAVEGVARSIKEFGFQQPIVVDSAGVIVIGHTRYKAAQWLGLVSVPVHVADDLSVEQITALRIADNSTGEAATWDMDLLPIELASLRNADYDIAETGLDPDLMAGLLDPKPATVTEDEVPEPPVDPITKPGDLWLLGEHRLLCGDSTKAEDVARLMDGELAEMMVTDPPYNVEYEGNYIQSGCIMKKEQKIWSGGIANDNRDDFAAWLALVFESCDSAISGGAAIYVWHPSGEDGKHFWSAWPYDLWHFQVDLVWNKTSLIISRWDYKPQHEPCMYGWKGKNRRWIGPNNEPTVWDIPRQQGASGEARVHPTQKPVECMARAIRNHDAPLVYDPFLGSGTTLIAAEQLGRKCFGMEVSPAYCDVIVKRWENLTGRTAELIEQ